MSEASWTDPPWVALHARLLERADALERERRAAEAAALRELVGSWWEEQEAWRLQLFELLRLHHDLNNALVGIRGNAQLMMMGPAVQLPGVQGWSAHMELLTFKRQGFSDDALNRVKARCQELSAGFGQVDLWIPPARGVLEHVVERAVIDEVHRRQPLVRQAFRRVRLPDHRQAIGIRIRERPQHDAIEDGEDGSRCADAERW